MAGKVTLVGAGPGDIGLFTIKGARVLKEAEVVVYDRLVGEDILALIPENAEKIDAGKKSSNHTIPQNEINEILLQKALDGKNVVRLKGGDCFLFGRGGEELELLEKNNIPFEVVPGITSALAVPAYAGIPVTHRDYVSSVHIITGHQKKNEPVNINFKNCVECGGTLVFLMGVSNMPIIIKGLIDAGMKKEMPAAVIENGTRPNQRKVTGCLSDIVEKSKEADIGSPAIIIVGEVCSLSEQFDWFTKRIKPMEIEKRSFEIISDRLKGRTFGGEVDDIVKRCIHTSADFDYADNLVFSENVVEKALSAIKAGAVIVTDTTMAWSGINKKILESFGGKAVCYIADEDVAKSAKERGVTRAICSMEKACELKGPVIFAIGNAPTALIKIKELKEKNILNPALVIGVPVGFVNVVESKEMIIDSNIPYIVARGNKGGSNIAAAICNALLYKLRR